MKSKTRTLLKDPRTAITALRRIYMRTIKERMQQPRLNTKSEY